MFGFGKKKSKAVETKNLPPMPRSFMIKHGEVNWFKDSYDTLIAEVYEKNPIAFRCMDVIGTNFSEIPLKSYTISSKGEKKEIPGSEFDKIVQMPNPLQTSMEYRSDWVPVYYLGGYVPVHLITVGKAGKDKRVTERWVLKPDKVSINYDVTGRPNGYLYDTPDGKKKPFALEEIQYIRSADPTLAWKGVPLVQSALHSIAAFNARVKQHMLLLQNHNMPEGIVSVAGEPGDEVLEDMNHKWKEKFGVPGEILFTGKGDIDFTPITFSPADMESLASQQYDADLICSVLGVAPEIIGLRQAKFTNYQEARLALYVETIIPLLFKYVSAQNRTISATYGPEYKIVADLSGVKELQEDREALIAVITQAIAHMMITPEEGRIMLEMEASNNKELQKYLVSNSLQAAEDLRGNDLP